MWDSVVNSDGSRYLPKTRVPGWWKCHGVMHWGQIEWIFFLFVSIFLLCLKIFCKSHMLFKKLLRNYKKSTNNVAKILKKKFSKIFAYILTHFLVWFWVSRAQVSGIPWSIPSCWWVKFNTSAWKQWWKNNLYKSTHV